MVGGIGDTGFDLVDVDSHGAQSLDSCFRV